MTSDSDLLRQYADHGDEAAFAEVVRRQADLVYSVALRVTANSALAEEVTQTVFTLLARRAKALCHYDTLVGWLHTTARNTAINAVRGESRRRAREQEAVIMQDSPIMPEANWAEIGPLLDEAVGTLSEQDSKAVLLRFFKNQSHQEVGAALGLSEDTARKRVERALEKLRSHFASRGVTASSALLAASLTANSVQAAPVGLAEKIAPISLAGIGGAGAGSAFLLALIMSTKTKTILAIVVVLAIAATLAVKLGGSGAAPATASSTPSTPTPVAASLPKASTSAPQVATPTMAPLPAHGAVSADTGLTATASTVPANADLKTDVPTLIHLLEIDDFNDLIDYIIPPEELQHDLQAQTREVFANKLREELGAHGGAAMLLDALHSIDGQEPVLNDTGDVATFRLGPATIATAAGHDEIKFKKMNGLWYGPQ